RLLQVADAAPGGARHIGGRIVHLADVAHRRGRTAGDVDQRPPAHRHHQRVLDPRHPRPSKQDALFWNHRIGHRTLRNENSPLPNPRPPDLSSRARAGVVLPAKKSPSPPKDSFLTAVPWTTDAETVQLPFIGAATPRRKRRPTRRDTCAP